MYSISLSAKYFNEEDLDSEKNTCLTRARHTFRTVFEVLSERASDNWLYIDPKELRKLRSEWDKWPGTFPLEGPPYAESIFQSKAYVYPSARAEDVATSGIIWYVTTCFKRLKFPATC